jgi:DNA phosphorothioation-dependent restriction protein DptH
MSYFADSAWSYLAKKIYRIQKDGSGNRRLLVIIPAFPEAATLALAETFANRCVADTNLELTIKIAQVVFKNWSEPGTAKAKLHDWIDDRGNLTYYRNLPIKTGKTNLVILCGGDRVTDAGGLADFHICDLDTIWKAEMKSSFQSWIAVKLKTIGIENVETAKLKEFDRLLKPLLEHGNANLIAIGDWLESLDLNSADSTLEVMKIILGRFDTFHLPKFFGFSLRKQRATLSPYIEKANAFFAYTMFLDSKDRDKAIKAVDQLLETHAAGLEVGVTFDDPEVIGPYSDGQMFLQGLKKYILEEDYSERNLLKQCDFVTIVDKILKFRKKSEEKQKPDSLHKLSGGAIEMALHAVWQTLREFGRDKRFADAHVQQIDIVADRFKHDDDSVEDDDGIDSTLDRAEKARQYLQRLLGGVDELVASRLELPRNETENLPVASSLADDQIPCVYAKTAEPQLEFSVVLAHDGGEKPYRRKFAWRLPAFHSYRLAESLIHWTKDAIDADSATWKLPAFHLPYYEELLHANDDEETRRVMLHCVGEARPDDQKMTNLLGQEWMSNKDILLAPMKKLAEKYTLFIHSAYKNGLHAALFSDKWADLRHAYAAACGLVVQDPKGSESQMAGMLLRVFMVIQRRMPQLGSAWAAESFERSGIATVLHPATLEMLEAQVLFLFSCFNAASTIEIRREDRRKAFAENIWTGYVDLASIQSPIVGLLYNVDQSLDANVRGHDLIHRIGSPEDCDATLSTRLLVRYDNGNDEEEVADAEMFRETRESKLLFRLMTDYFRLHPHARDGLSLAVFRNQDIQPIIAAVHQYLNKLADPNDCRYYVLRPDSRKPYAISVTIFTESGDDVDVARWIEQWQERWEAAETENKFQVYRRCRFSVAHRIVEPRQLGSFQRLINDSFEADIAVLYDFIGAGQGGNRFSEVAPFDIRERTLKFPILEKSCCAVRHPTDNFKRSRVISNRQFVLGTLHAEVMNRLKNPGVQAAKEFVILGVGDFSPWRVVVDAFHAKAEWVICIDPNMDERLIKLPSGDRKQEREIIGFGSGVGSHGEANYTISTEQFSLADIYVRLAASIQEVYAGCGWAAEDCQSVAKGVLAEAHELSGLSLVRATGVGYYIRDFMAYSLTRKMLREKHTVLCDHLVSLDAYRHWFDQADDERRPDLMWLTAWLDPDKRVCMRIHLIECKMAQQSDEHLLKARTQINNGLRILIPAFAPRSQDGGTLGDDNRPDQRYWWLQLHRLITSKAEIENSQQAEVLSALERLAEGDYVIDWSASVFAFWSDDKSDAVKRIGRWKPNESEDRIANIYTIGSEFVRKLAIDATSSSLTWSEWNEQVQDAGGNVCYNLDDIELPSDKEDDDDMLPWEEQQDREEGEEEPEGADLSETQLDEPVVCESEPESGITVIVPDMDVISPSPAVEITPADATSEGEEKSVTVIAPSIPDRILLGKTVNGERPVYWEFGHAELANRHMLVFGTSGMGKTYAIQCLLSELARKGQNSLIIDYTDGFIPSKLEKGTAVYLNPKQHFIQQAPLPIIPFKAQVSEEAGMTFKDTPITIAKRVAAIFKSVYELGNQQFPILIDAITEGLEHSGDDFSMASMLEVLHTYIDDNIHATGTVRTTISKLKPFIQSNPFANDKNGIGWLELFTDTASRCHVFQFFKVDKHSARALIEFVLWDLYSFVSSLGHKNIPRVVVLDEVQNIDLGPDAPVAKYLTEGRKHGLALITATQTVKGVGGVNDARVSRLFQAEHKIFFKPTENEIREHAQLLHNAISNVSIQDWAARLASLQIGECWSLGRSLNEATGRLVFQAQRIKITSLEERGFNV